MTSLWDQTAGATRSAMRNKRLLVGLASLTLLDIAAAGAADLPVKAPPPAPVQTYNWSGFYLGAHAGYRWANADFSGPGYDFAGFPFPSRSEGYRLNGGIFGVQAGYNYMLTPAILAGVEGDWSWGSSHDNAGGTIFVFAADGISFASEAKLTWQATIRGRLGVVNGPWLFYGTVGAAFARLRWTDNSTFIFNGVPVTSFASEGGKTLTGIAAGVGIEYLLTQNVIARLEYLYENFGDVSVPFGLGPQIGTLDLKDVNKVRVAISYKFGP
jgi:outer membrane autotransporter protein